VIVRIHALLQRLAESRQDFVILGNLEQATWLIAANIDDVRACPTM
jgi:hypothetical protein